MNYTARHTDGSEWTYMTELANRKGIGWIASSVALRYHRSSFTIANASGAVVFEYRAGVTL